MNAPFTTIISHSEEETLELGRRLAATLPPGSVLALHGDLGAGKTALSRGIAAGLGITEPVTSPTFTVVQEYPCQAGAVHWLFHLDMYRIDDERAAAAFGIDEFLWVADAIALIEWPERIAGLLDDPGRIHHLYLEHGPHGERRIILPAELPVPERESNPESLVPYA